MAAVEERGRRNREDRGFAMTRQKGDECGLL